MHIVRKLVTHGKFMWFRVQSLTNFDEAMAWRTMQPREPGKPGK